MDQQLEKKNPLDDAGEIRSQSDVLAGQFRIPPIGEADTADARPVRAKRQFLRGPFDLPSFEFIAREGGPVAVYVWLLAHHRHRLRKEDWVTIPHTALVRLGVQSPKAKSRALRFLEGEGYIRVERGTGKAPRVMLVKA